MEKKARSHSFNTILRTVGENKEGIQSIATGVKTGLGLLLGGGYAFNKIKTKLQNDIRRKTIIEDLANNDPILRNEDKETILQYYATIYNVAPTISLDKNAVKELITSFVRFGRVDVQTLKTLAETERNVTQSKDKSLAIGSFF